MTPKTKLMYNYEYARRLFRGSGNFDDVWRRILGQGAIFEEIFYIKIGHILSAIEKYSGFGWEEFADAALPIYLATLTEGSFPNPLTLAVSDDPGTMVEDLVRQLSCRNMQFGFLTDAVRDDCLDEVTAYVRRDLGLADKISAAKYDLDKKTIKQYLKK